jgi:hypothetical protein
MPRNRVARSSGSSIFLFWGASITNMVFMNHWRYHSLEYVCIHCCGGRSVCYISGVSCYMMVIKKRLSAWWGSEEMAGVRSRSVSPLCFWCSGSLIPNPSPLDPGFSVVSQWKLISKRISLHGSVF